MNILDTASSKAGLGNVDKSAKTAEMPQEYRKFEASVLSTFVNSMLPSDSEQVYGKGSAGEFWKSMMAEQVADSMSKNGGIGIAEQMYSQSLARAQTGSMVNASTDDHDRSRAVSMITDFQRQILGVSASEKSDT
jgi:flagellar protein FlgJ